MQGKACLPVTQQHLNLLIMGRQVASRIAAVLILPAPFVATGCKLVGRQGAAAWRETTGDHDTPFTVPALVAL